MTLVKKAPAILVLAAALLLPFAADAALFRAYLSSGGSDANPCTLPQPCRLLPAALAAVDDGGEIWLLDSANYNTSQVAITKSVTILAIPGEIGSVVATLSGHGLLISAPSVTVTLRNLVIVGLGASGDGIRFLQGTALLVEGCTVAKVGGNGMWLDAPGSRVTIKDTTVRNVGNNAVVVGGPVNASIDNVHLVGSGNSGVFASTGAQVSVSDSVLSGHTYGVQAYSGTNLDGAQASGTARVLMKQSVLTANTNGAHAFAFAPAASFAEVVASGNAFTGNGTDVVVTQANAGVATVTADGNSVIGNNVGFSFPGGNGTIYTHGNNSVRGNSGGDVVGSALTLLGKM